VENTDSQAVEAFTGQEPTIEENNVNESPVEERKADPSIPYARFKEVNDEMKALKEELSKAKGADERRRKAELEKQGEYKTLLEEANSELTHYKDKAGQWDTYQSARRDALLSKIADEEDRVVISSAPLEVVERFVEKTTNSNPSPKVDQSRAGTVFGGYDDPVEWAVKDPDGYQKAREAEKSKGIWGGFFNSEN
jgi:hypothetical protein